MIIEFIKKSWSTGTDGQPPGRVRQIGLTNQIALFAGLVTIPYQLYYLVQDVGHFLPLFVANLVFLGSYTVVFRLNGSGRQDAGRNLVLLTCYGQLFVVTAFISTAAGVHLFYLALGGLVALNFSSRSPVMPALVGLAALLFLVCQVTFPPGSTVLHVPAGVAQIMYAGSATGTVLVTGGLAYIFRLEIEKAEDALMASNRELERLNAVDPLTGLANRRALDLYIEREWWRMPRQAHGLSLIICDIDCFKPYNDHYGHLAGDACLQRVAEALREASARASDLVARYGGEEFVFVLPATDAAGALQVAERARELVAALRIPHAASTVAPVVTLSMGVVTAESVVAEGPTDLLRRADAALYTAKQEGRNRVVLAAQVEGAGASAAS